MCGRISQKGRRDEFKNFIVGFDPAADLYRPNIKPTQSVEIVILSDDRPITASARWWFQKEGAKEFRTEYTTFNARSDKIQSSFLYRQAVRSKRCLVPVSSFYEWSEKGKPPHEIFLPTGQPFSLAGLWSSYQETTFPMISFTIITCEPNEFMKSIHNRMPVILSDRRSQEKWLLEGDTTILRSYGDELASARLSASIETAYPMRLPTTGTE